MKILVINSGSSSIKYQLISLPENKILCKGLVERIGLSKSVIHYVSDQFKIEDVMDIPNHQVGLEKIADLLLDKEKGVLQDAQEIHAVGHRVVHGGSIFAKTTLINEKVKSVIKSLYSIAPLHNPPNLTGIEVAEQVFPKAKQVAVFDTAFHQSIPEVAHRYAIPNKLYDQEHIRVYGFHGTSHQYVSKKATELLEKKKTKIISIHLGNGCSMTAIQDGKSIDTSLGFGTMNGLIMGTRSGDLDQSVILFLEQHLGYSSSEITNMLQKQSGMLGLTGMSDLRDIEAAAERGEKMPQLALAMNAYRIKKYIGSFIAIMNGIDAILFTAGIGENSDVIRQMVCADLDYLGIKMDSIKNKKSNKGIREIQTKDSKVKIFIIPTNEELEIAQQTYHLLSD
jgi:acetate kinase